MESARAHPFALPGIAWRKFLAPINADSGGRFEEYAFHEKQAFSLIGKADIARTIAPGLVGAPLDTYDQARAFVEEHYNLGRVQWFNILEARWQAAAGYLHLPAFRYSDTYDLPGLPLYHLCAMLGALTALFRPGPARRFHWAFVPTLFGTGFIVALTAAVIPRHRFVLEPFWLLYLFVLLDGCAVLAACRRKVATIHGARPAEAPVTLST